MLPKICLATNNQGKIKELDKMLKGSFDIVSLKDIGCHEDIAETAHTFEGNSLLKARYVYEHYHIDCIADDSGLEVMALNGEPGVFSARYAGEHGNHEKNMAKLLNELSSKSDRSAQFRTVVTFIQSGKVHQFEGLVKGSITSTKIGEEGFGYDPIFKPAGHDLTFAQMPPEEKNPISHRGKAIQKLLEHFRK